jgi:hypothetical protein
MADGIVELRVLDYTIVTNTTVATMITTVKTNLGEGWSLIGPPFFDGSTFNQGMVKFQPIVRGDK